MGAARTDAPPAALSKAEIREALERDTPPPPIPAAPPYVDEPTGGQATATGKRCVHCAHPIKRRDGVRFCDAPFTCWRGPVAYTGVQQLRDLGYIPQEPTL